MPSTALPGATDGGPGSILRMGGTGWRTLDFHRIQPRIPAHEIHVGSHYNVAPVVSSWCVCV